MRSQSKALRTLKGNSLLMKIVGVVWDLDRNPELDLYHLYLLTETPGAQFLLTYISHAINL